LAFGNERISCLLNTVVDKLIGALQTYDQLQTDSLPQIRVNLLCRVSANGGKGGDLGNVSQAGKLLQCLLGFDRQAAQLSDHEIRHIIGVTLGVNATEVPGPSRPAMIEVEEPLLYKGRNELNGKKWIAARLFVHQLRQRSDAFRVAVKTIRN